ncbi:hypothetical protein J6590_017781 [Homalodisca vitripennis]|nr:hypothetical protein J6590_017781 [Homalodisca vitripennis]
MVSSIKITDFSPADTTIKSGHKDVTATSVGKLLWRFHVVFVEEYSCQHSSDGSVFNLDLQSFPSLLELDVSVSSCRTLGTCKELLTATRTFTVMASSLTILCSSLYNLPESIEELKDLLNTEGSYLSITEPIFCVDLDQCHLVKLTPLCWISGEPESV